MKTKDTPASTNGKPVPKRFANLRDLPPLPPGDLRLYDNLLPKLPAGINYSIQVKQIVDFPHYDKPKPSLADRTFTNQLPFIVEAPQFVLNGPQQVFSVSPSGGQSGDFSAQLPHIVFTDPFLPWARGIDPVHELDFPGTPWLAVLLLDEEDFPGGALPTVNSLPITEILAPPASENVFRPSLPNVLPSDQSNTELRIDAIDIPTALFLQLVPRLDELALLSHVREVNPANKEEKLLFGQGRYSTVVANRFPDSSGDGRLNGCYLISVEGFASYLSTCSGSPAPATITQPTVRLVVLASWTFRSAAKSISFAARMNDLSVGPFGLIQPAPGASLAAPTTSSPTPAAYATQVLGNGYVPLNHDPTWLGEKTAAWYRGPLAPFAIEEVMPLHYENSDAATIYDDTVGVFDLSYAVAWQAGRLLALSSRAFASNLLAARQQGIQLVQDAAKRADLIRLLDPIAESERLAALARPRLVKELAHRFAAELLAGESSLLATRRDPKRPHGAQAGRVPLDELVDALQRGLDPVLIRS